MNNSPPFHIRLFGNFRLSAGDIPVTTLNTARLQALLAYLVLHRDAPHLRQQLAFQFWPDSSESQARTNLRKLFFQLQRALPQADRFLLANIHTLSWNAQAEFTLDVAELQQRLAHLQKEPLDLDTLRRVVELYQGELLPSCYDDWIAPLRQQLHQAVLDALERLITLLENQRSYAAGIDYARRLLAFDPLQEKTYQRLMRLHALDGDYTGALRIYQDCVSVLQHELDVEPDADTQTLYKRLLQRDTTLTAKLDPKLPPTERLPLVGRQHEWEVLRNAWHKAVQGQSHLVWLWGEAGIGKTRLAEELLDWTRQQGVLIARTRSYQAQGALAYAPITSLLRSLPLASRLRKLSETWLIQLARLLPEMQDERPNLPMPQPMTESWQRQHFFEALARAVLVDDQPLMLFFDDLHWCDQETVEWLNYLLHFAPQARLLVIGTSRIEAVDGAHPLTPLRQDLHREALMTEIELAPLNATEVTMLAGTLADQVLTHEQIRQLYADTEGNPLFVVETMRAGQADIQAAPGKEAQEQGEVTENFSLSTSLLVPKSTLPPKVYAVIHTRLTQLSSSAQRTASLAAVIGRSFTFAVLLAAAHTDEDTLIDSLDELGERRILREQAADGYDFSHDRIREVAYAELSRARRRQLHRHVAEALEEIHASNLDEVSGLLAEHYERAGNAEKAIHYWQCAGEQAAKISAYREALTLYNRALTVVSSQEKSNTSCSQQPRIILLNKLADIHVSLAEYSLARQLREESLTLARASGDPKNTANSLSSLGEIALVLSEYAKAVPLYQQALALYQDMGELTREANVLYKLGYIAYYQGRIGNAAQLYEQALVITQAISDHSGEAQVIGELGTISEDCGDNIKAKQLYQKALLIYQTIGDRSGEAKVLNKMGCSIFNQSNYVQATKLYEQALLTYPGIGEQRMVATTLNNLGYVAYVQGDYAKATKLDQQALLTFREIGDRSGEAYTWLGIGLTTYAQGEYVKATQLYKQALATFREIGERSGEVETLNRLGGIACTQGKYTQATQLHQQALAICWDIDYRSGAAKALLGLGWAATEQGKYAEATQWLQQALTINKEIRERSEEAKVFHALASTAWGQQAYQVARDYFCQVLAISLEIGLTPVLLASLVDMTQLLAQENRQAQALQLLGLALHAPQIMADTKKRATLLISKFQTEMQPAIVTGLLQAGAQLNLPQVVQEILQATG